MAPIIEILVGGIDALREYLSAHVLLCLIPAFFIAGAMSVFLSKQAVLRYFGHRVKKRTSYSIAAISGSVLAVCSCVAIPLFAGIYRRGAGIGPATTFLFSTPAISILAIVLTARVIGFDIGLARAVAAILTAILIGLIMAAIFGKEKRKLPKPAAHVGTPSEKRRSNSQSLALFVMLILILIFGTAELSTLPKAAVLITLIVGLLMIVKKWYSRNEVKVWGIETYGLLKMIFPLLLIGVFIVGMIQVVLPREVVGAYLGGNALSVCLLASVIGALMYLPTLVEVPVVTTLMGLGMGIGPALSLLLAGPALSFPNMLGVGRVIGPKKTLAYISLVIVAATISGYLFGNLPR